MTTDNTRPPNTATTTPRFLILVVICRRIVWSDDVSGPGLSGVEFTTCTS